MIRTKLAKKVLTKKLQRHLTEMEIHSVESLRRAIDFHEKNHAESVERFGEDIPFFLGRCPECREAARRLGVIK